MTFFGTFGQIAHTVFQAALSTNNFEMSNLQSLATKEIQANLIYLYSCGETDESSKEKINSMLPAMVEWSKVFLPSQETNLGIYLLFLKKNSK